MEQKHKQSVTGELSRGWGGGGYTLLWDPDRQLPGPLHLRRTWKDM